jgi:hypothetical protein
MNKQPPDSVWSAVPSRTARRLAAAALCLALGCTTTWAEIHGPRAGLGLDLDENLDASPRVELGYHWLKFKDALGFGAGGTVTYSPVSQWTQLSAEANFWIFPLLGFPLTPFAFRVGAGFHPDEGAALVLGFGLGGVLYKPPVSCNLPLEGDWHGCPPGDWWQEDVVYPDMIGQIGYLFSALPVASGSDCLGGGDCTLMLHSITFHTTLAWFLFTGGLL